MARENDRLDGPGPVNQINGRLRLVLRRRPMVFLRHFAGLPAANSFSSLGMISSSVVSPTTMSVALFGLNQVSWNFRRSARRQFPTDASVPEPVNGLP